MGRRRKAAGKRRIRLRGLASGGQRYRGNAKGRFKAKEERDARPGLRDYAEDFEDFEE
jgi:hypothetical protein